MTDLYSILVSAGQVLGVPLAVALTIGAFVIRDLNRRVAKLESRLEDAEKTFDEKVSDLYDLVNGIARDVAFIKGRMEKE